MAAALALASGCTTPARQFDDQAQAQGFQHEVILGNGFEHAAFWRIRGENKGRLHVYIGSDGSPWIQNRRIARDPTPRTPLALELMTLDPSPSLYLGRPCYHGISSEARCHPGLWTHARYSAPVVNSMVDALRRILHQEDVKQVVLIGYSGGGTLAMLMAQYLGNVRAVVTIAGNLDIDAWTALHNYSPLTDSLNPADMPALPPEMIQIHLVGTLDRNVPPWITRQGLRRQPDSNVVEYLDTDHSNDWKEKWSAVLSDLRDRLDLDESRKKDGGGRKCIN